MEDQIKKQVNELEPKPLLPAGYLFKAGDFSILLDECTGELKVTVLHTSKHIKIRPKSDNSIVLIACR